MAAQSRRHISGLQSSHGVTSVMGLRRRLMNLLLLPWSGTRGGERVFGAGGAACRPVASTPAAAERCAVFRARRATACSLTLRTSPGTCRGPSGPWSSPES